MSTEVTVKIPSSVHQQVKIESIRRGVQLKEATEQALKLWLKAKPAKKESQPA